LPVSKLLLRAWGREGGEKGKVFLTTKKKAGIFRGNPEGEGGQGKGGKSECPS